MKPKTDHTKRSDQSVLDVTPGPRPRKRYGTADLPHSALRVLLTARTAALQLLEPFDYVARVLNGKRRLPPLALRRYAGPLATLDASGAEFLAYLKLLCGTKADSSVLDIGCGFGLVALYLEEYLTPPGKYLGLDINHDAVAWAQRRISRRAPYLQFLHLDIKNGAYNPGGAQSAGSVVFPIPSQSFDIILLKSVFTHLRPLEVTNYLREIRRILKPDGVCLATFFLLNESQEANRILGKNAVEFSFGDDLWRHAVAAMPELAIAFREEYLSALVEEAGLTVRQTHHGTWTGRHDGLSYQDIVILRLKHELTDQSVARIAR